MQKKFKFNILTFMLSIAICFAFQPVNSTLANCPDDIFAYWKLDEPTGPPNSEYVDIIRRNDGTGTAGILSVSGIVGNAQEFDGTAATTIDVAADRFFDWAKGDSFSIELWVKKPDGVAPGNLMPAIGRYEAPNLQWWVGMNADGTALFALVDKSGDDATVSATVASPIILSDGAWHHVVAVRDAGNAKNILYVDGVKQGEVSKTYTAGFDSATAKISIGWLDYNAPDFYFEGLIDEVALYDRIMPQTEAGEHYTAGLAGTDVCSGSAPFVPFPDDTLAYWQLDESTSPPNNKYLDTFDGNDGTGTAGILSVSGIVGNAQEFDGTAATTIDVAADRFFDWAKGDSFSIELWVKKPDGVAPGNLMPAIGRYEAPNLQWWVGMNADGTALFALVDKSGDDATVSATVASPIILSDGAWHHVVAVRDAGNAKNILYVDGVKQGEVSKTYTAGFDSATAKISIGWLDYNAPDFYFEGLIDEVALYDRIMPQTEAGEHRAAGLLGNGILTLRPEPSADAGPDQSVLINAPVTLDGSGSSDDGSLAYLWEQTAGATVTLSGAATDMATFTAPAAAGTLTFRLTVTDTDNLSDTDTVNVVVGTTTTTPPPATGGGDDGGGGCFIGSMF